MTEKEIADVPVEVGEGTGETEGMNFACWEHGGLSYAVTSFGHTEEEFAQVLEDLVKTTE